MPLRLPGRPASLAVIVCLAATALPSAQGQPAQQLPVFRAAAELVEVIVRVTDKQGRFVPGLTQADFELREEGRQQTIVAFNSVNLERPPVRTVEAAQPILREPVATTVATNADTAESRAFVLLMDDMLTSPMASRSARQAAREFVQRYVGPTDLVAAFSTGGRGVQTQEFTADKTRVLATIDRFLGRRCRTQANPKEDSPRANAFRQEGNNEQIYDIRVVTDVIKTLASHLSGIRGRRVSLLWVSEGIDYNPRPVISGTVTPTQGGEPDPAAVNHAMQEAIQALQRANVTLYAVDPRRLYAAEQLLPEELPEGMQPDTTSNPTCRGANAQELQRSLDTLREFATKTGGFAAVNTNEFATTFDRVLDDSSQYYVLGYQPASRGRDGEFKRIEVRTRRSGLQVSARAGYVVSDPKPPAPGPAGVGPELAAVLTSSLPTAGLPLRVQAIPRRGPDDRGLVYVVVELGGRDLQFAEANGRSTERVEFGLIAIDSVARMAGLQPVAVDLSLTPPQVSQVRATGIRWLTSVTLAPGHYSLRVAARAVGTNRTGSIFLDVDVPDFTADELRIDGVALTSLPALLGITMGTSPIAMGLTGPPTAARTFVKGDVITVGMEIHTSPRAFTSGAVELAVRPQAAAAGSKPVLQRILTLADRAALDRPRLFQINTAELAAGAYVLRLTVRDSTGRSAQTAAMFEVVEQKATGTTN
jgi:VWFA-related protein